MAGKFVLILESGLPVIPFEQSLLLRKEHDVQRVSSREAALEVMEKRGTDLLVAVEDPEQGVDEAFLRNLRKDERFRKVATLLLTRHPEEYGPEGPANRVLRIPVDGEAFTEACGHLLNISPRGSARLLVYVQVQGYVGQKFFLCNSMNLSATGVLLLTSRRLRIGDTVNLMLTLPRQREKVEVNGKVVREAKEIKSRLHGYGVAFQDLDPAAAERINAFLQEIGAAGSP